MTKTKRYYRVAEVLEICGVGEDFLATLEREEIVRATVRRAQKVYALEQVDRIRVAHVLVAEMGVNLEGAEIVLHMRERMIGMQRQLEDLLERMARERGR